MSGSINRTTQALDQELQQSLRKLWSEFLQFKNRQPVGGDVLKVQGYPDNNQVQVGGPLTLDAYGSGYPSGNFNFVILPSNQTLTIWNFAVTLYVDPTFDPVTGIPDNAHALGGGSSTLTYGQRNCAADRYMDWAESNDSNNLRAFKVRVINFDSSSHSYYIAIRAYLPNINQ
jgi:hypothetical protein